MTTTPSSDVGDVLAPVGRFFEEVEDLLPLDDGDGVLLFPKSDCTAAWCARSASFSSRLISTAHSATPLRPLERLRRRSTTCSADVADEMRELARAGPHAVDVIEPHDGGRRVDRVHHVVERPREGVDVFAIERRHERAVQALDEFVRQEVALVLDFLDLVGLVPERLIGREHGVEQDRRPPRICSAMAMKSS